MSSTKDQTVVGSKKSNIRREPSFAAGDAKQIRNDFGARLEAQRDKFAVVFPKSMKVNAEEFIRACIAEVEKNVKLVKVLHANPTSLYLAINEAATFGLIPGKECYFEIDRDEQVPTAQFCAMWNGIAKRLYADGLVSKITAHEVRENDAFRYTLGDDERIDHEPALSDRGDITAAYAIFHTPQGERVREVMSWKDIETVKKMAQSEGGIHAWKMFTGEMCRKVVCKRGAKHVPGISQSLQNLIQRDFELRHLDAAAYSRSNRKQEVEPAPAEVVKDLFSTTAEALLLDPTEQPEHASLERDRFAVVRPIRGGDQIAETLTPAAVSQPQSKPTIENEGATQMVADHLGKLLADSELKLDL